MGGFFEDWWRPRGYETWYHYIWQMPILATAKEKAFVEKNLKSIYN